MVRSVEESIKSEKEAHYIMHSIHVLNFVLFFLTFFCQNFGVNCFQITYTYTIDITAIVRGPR